MMKSLFLVASGGALGASLRYVWAMVVFRLAGSPAGFPVAIMGANILGSFLMGAFVVFAANRGLTHYSPFIMTGVLGGFTTFSAFSLETVTLIERGELWQAGLYVALSVGLSIFGLMAGMSLTRMAVL
ncbi:MAG: fluoride efflux transporter CrcB [Roseobacter sp.]